MNTAYVQKSSTVQKASSSKVASVPDSSAQSVSLQRKADLANRAAQCASLPPRPNNTGMPDDLKSGIESLSGFSMDDVRVHYNSSKPATVQALAYTQGTDIHVAPGQEKCLPHEAWHVAQQMAGRVSPTTNINGMPVNDNATLEHEADVMGEKAVQCKGNNGLPSLKCMKTSSNAVQCYDHIETLEGEITLRSTSTRDSAAGKLPHITFETMAGSDRWTELGGLYNDVIFQYNGRASVCMGVNTCRYKIKKIDGALWVWGEKKKEEMNSEMQNEIDRLGALITKKDNHDIKMVPFSWKYVGLGDGYEHLAINSDDVRELGSGKAPKKFEVVDKDFKLGSNPDKKNKKRIVVYKYPSVGDYFFPFFEARSLIMESASALGGDVFRWIDSDVRNDESINCINANGIDSRMLEYKNHPLIISGIYNWRNNAGGNDVVLNFLNLLERKIRYYYWCCSFKTIGDDVYGKFKASEGGIHRGYVPEPIVYMNSTAHNDALKKLQNAAINAHDDVQQRESDVAFDEMNMIFSENFSVSKPMKHYFDEIGGLPTVESLRVKGRRDATSEMLRLLKRVRQSVMSHWGIDKNLWPVIVNLLNNDEEIKKFLDVLFQ